MQHDTDTGGEGKPFEKFILIDNRDEGNEKGGQTTRRIIYLLDSIKLFWFSKIF